MRKLSLLLTLVLFTAFVAAQQPVVSFEKTTHDFGKIKEQDGTASVTFKITNKGDAPLVINRVHASCGCTTPTWTKEPILPGKSGNIVAAYDTKNRPGNFSKTISVFTNASTTATTLTIKGDVIPKPVVLN